jgi:sterol desaturase/sphingolipid hydroxylase (fatty acid hydroxylase superfamily)
MLDGFKELWDILERNGTRLLNYPLNAGERIFWLYLISSLLIALGIYFSLCRKNEEEKCSFKGFFVFLFPAKIWRTSSAWLDVRYFFFHQLVRISIYTGFLIVFRDAVYLFLTDVDLRKSRVLINSTTGDTITSFLYMIFFYLFLDFVSYFTHYLQHKVPFLWEFHKVHHSLEVMHPLSNYREHPVDNLFYAISTGAFFGLFMGLTYHFLGHLLTTPKILDITLIVFLFNIVGYNLRHSHIWLKWPGVWSKVFPSPAHHHVHHSYDPKHINKNFAFMFPFWDVLFRTYYMPEDNKDVKFGLSENPDTEYKSCLGLYFRPILNVVKGVGKKQTDSIEQD